MVLLYHSGMKFISFLLLNVLSQISGLTTKPKLCVNCKYFVKDFFSANKFGKCSQFPRQDDSKYHLVTGIDDRKQDLYYCSTARSSEHMCGEDAKKYVPKKGKSKGK